MAATLRQVAELTRLSIPTVSEILNNKGRLYKATTRERVRAAALELRYRPNFSARSVRTGRFGSIAILQSSSERRNYLPASFLNKIETETSARGLVLMLGRVSDEQLNSADTLPHVLKNWATDGLLINYVAQFPERMMELITYHQIPAIWLNSKHECNCIYPDDENAAFVATNYLIKLGHDRIAHVNYNFGQREVSHYSSQDRLLGYTRAMTAAGLGGRNIQPELGPLAMTDRFEYTRRWLAAPHRPTAVLAYNAQVAQPILYAAATMEISVPDDLSIITFNDQSCDSLGMPVATMVLPEEEMARLGVESLLAKINQPSLKSSPLAIPLMEDLRNTTARPRPCPTC